MSQKNKDKWEGAFRAAGEGDLGIHLGKPVYTVLVAEDRRKALAVYAERTWIEMYKEGQWKRCSNVFHS
jgi:hypothetical protein